MLLLNKNQQLKQRNMEKNQSTTPQEPLNDGVSPQEPTTKTE